MDNTILAAEMLAYTRGVLGQADAAPVQSVWNFVVKGGPMMIPIGLASLIALTVVIERLLTLKRNRVIPPDFLPGLRQHLHDPAQALAFCDQRPGPLSNIFAAVVRRLRDPVERLEKRVEEAGRREVLKLRKHLRLLAVIASVTPLMGLLGTIFGMIRAFQTVAASGAALGRTELLARGIYEAMITTAAGLIVAIPVLICHHWIAGKIERLVLEIDQMTVEFVEEHHTGESGVPLQTDSREPMVAAQPSAVPSVTEPAVAPATA